MVASLNEQQRAAAESRNQYLAIIAGPGTGKTLTLAARVAFLVESGVDAKQVCAITFTQKAAAELRDRVIKLVGDRQKLPFIGTFHSLAYQELRRLQPELRLISAQEQQRLLRQITTQLSLKDAQQVLSQVQNKAVSVTEVPIAAQQLVAAYHQALTQAQAVDFDGLLAQWLSALKEKAVPSFQYVLIDEFQDTNQLQLEIITELLAPGGSLTVIGDPRQAIYGFRGASSQSFEWLRDQFPGLTEVTLRTNYRSAPEIVATAQRLFPDDPALQPAVTEPGQVQIIETLDEYTEAAAVVRSMEEVVGGTDLLQSQTGQSETGLSFADLAVLYRSKGLCRQLVRLLSAKGIPYQVVGEESMFVQPRCLLTVVGVYTALGGELEQLFELQPELAHQLETSALEALKTEDTDQVVKLAQSLARQTGWEETLTKNMLLKNQWQQWLSGLIRFTEPTTHSSCRTYLLEQLTQQSTQTAADRVTLLTMHAAKGLEFAQVFILACEAGSIPHAKATDLAEEERLFYVALTRAKQHLVMTFARQRTGKKVSRSPLVDKLSRDWLRIEQDSDLQATLKKRAAYRTKKSQLQLF